MESKDSKSLDLLGIKPIADAVNTTVTKSFQAVESFLKSVCSPALDEVGLMLKDKIRYWRLNNILKVLEKAQDKLEFTSDTLQIKAHPRVALAIIENASVIDNDEVQDLWAGLFASSCKNNGQNDENLIFVNTLKLLTTAQAKLIKHICILSPKIIHENGLVSSHEFIMDLSLLKSVMELDDIHRIDRELDYLRSLELINSGFVIGGIGGNLELTADVAPSTLALNLFVRCQGFPNSIEEYWKEELISSSKINTVTGKIRTEQS